MIRGTTPTHTFATSISLVDAEAVAVTYKQGVVIVEKTKDECEITEDTLTVKLSQEDTLAFKTYGYRAEVQITVKFADGSVLKSNISQVDVSKTLKEGVI
jgi:hypothetical protein